MSYKGGRGSASVVALLLVGCFIRIPVYFVKPMDYFCCFFVVVFYLLLRLARVLNMIYQYSLVLSIVYITVTEFVLNVA